jgi:hypothetical protein
VFRLQMGCKDLLGSINRMKPHLGTAKPQVAEPAPRTRPPAATLDPQPLPHNPTGPASAGVLGEPEWAPVVPWRHKKKT